MRRYPNSTDRKLVVNGLDAAHVVGVPMRTNEHVYRVTPSDLLRQKSEDPVLIVIGDVAIVEEDGTVIEIHEGHVALTDIDKM